MIMAAMIEAVLMTGPWCLLYGFVENEKHNGFMYGVKRLSVWP